MATGEPTINDALAAVLRLTRNAWRNSNIVCSEPLGALTGTAERPDILVVEPNVSPVAIETEVLPAITVESEARSRLGRKTKTYGRVILSSIAVRVPLRFREKQGLALQQALTQATDLEMALFTGSASDGATRWPPSGWLTGSVADLSLLAQLASVPPEVVDAAADILIKGVEGAAAMLNEAAQLHPGLVSQISAELRQEDGAQTRRMAVAILANAFVFHEVLAGGQDELTTVKTLEQLRGAAGGFNKSAVLQEWRKVLAVNYWPIFDIARRILELVPSERSAELVETLADTAQKLLENRLMRSHDLTGQVFQRLIVDRKFLAAFYTTPASAALLVGLAITEDSLGEGKSWANAADVKSLRIADFACGTGTLLSTAYQRVSYLHELNGGNAESLHPDMMASALIGCDVLPAAAHLTASMLAGAHPTVKYNQSSIFTMPYGKQPNGSIALGSLDLLRPEAMFPVLEITGRVLHGSGQVEAQAWHQLPDFSFSAVIMNPPFTRPTNHEGHSANVPNPMFAAFSSSKNEQEQMAQAMKRLTKGTSASGNAGEASVFVALADKKLKPGGVLAMVLPLSLMVGESWEDTRAMLVKRYSDLTLVSIAGREHDEMSFSADTGMGECLVVGRKTYTKSERAAFVVLRERPAYPLVGADAAAQIHRLIRAGKIRRLEDGPLGGTQINFGSNVIGQIIDAPLPGAEGWNLGRVADFSLAQTAYQLERRQLLWLPGMEEQSAKTAPITKVSAIGEVGPIDRDINGINPGGGARGPFDITPISPESAPTYPVLWAHNAQSERTMLFEGDSEGVPRAGMTPGEASALTLKRNAVWKTASHCHFNRDFQFNAQSTGFQFTTRPTIGGRAWLSIRMKTVEHEKALVVWGNASLGLLLRWWHSNKQQAARGSVSKLGLQGMPILDVTALAPDRLAAAVRIFDELCDQAMLPMHQMNIDPVRRELDERFGREVLGLPEAVLGTDGPLALLRLKLSREPSVRGSK